MQQLMDYFQVLKIDQFSAVLRYPAIISHIVLNNSKSLNRSSEVELYGLLLMAANRGFAV